MSSTLPPTRYDAPDTPERGSRGGLSGPALIAGSIVVAGFLLGLGVFLAVLIRGGAGVGQPQATPTPTPAANSAPAGSPQQTTETSPPAGSPQQTPTREPTPSAEPGDPLGAYLARLPSEFHGCAPSGPPSTSATRVVESLPVLYYAAESTRNCAVSRLALWLHSFDSVASMDAAFEEFAGPHLSHGDSCEVNIAAGAGPYSFDDGRQGRAVCLRTSTGHWIAWTDSTAAIVAVAYGTDTSAALGQHLLDFWRETFQIAPQ